MIVSPDIIILGLIAGVILFRLYSILGRKDTDGKMDSLKKSPIFKDVIDISSRVKTEDIKEKPIMEQDTLSGFEEVITKIREKEPSFSINKFLAGAKSAFEIILSSFAENDRNTLKNLLSADVYKQFIGEIDKRIKNEVVLSLTLVALPVTEIKNIQLNANNIIIDVSYKSQQITLLKNKRGDTIEGDSSQIDNIEDMWTFSKELNEKNNWLLVKVNAN